MYHLQIKVQVQGKVKCTFKKDKKFRDYVYFLAVTVMGRGKNHSNYMYVYHFDYTNTVYYAIIMSVRQG